MRRVLLIGQGPTAWGALASLLERFDVVALIRDVPEPGADPAVALAGARRVPVLRDASPAAVAAAVDRLAPDAVVVSSYDRLLPPALIASRPFVNVHYAPLPRYRGRANVNWAVINGERETAISVHAITPASTPAGFSSSRSSPIAEHDTVGDLYARLDALQRAHLAAAVERHLDGDPGAPQDEAAATYGCSRVPADGEIDWSRSTREVGALVRALVDPFPGAFTFHDGERLTVWEAAPAHAPRQWEGRVPGRVVGWSAAEGWADVLTGDGVLRLVTVQREGGARSAAAEVVCSVRGTLGLRPADLLARVRRLEALLGLADGVAANGGGPPASAHGGYSPGFT